MDKNKIEANHYDIKVLNISSSDSSLTTDFVLRKAQLCYETSVKKILQKLAFKTVVVLNSKKDIND